MKYTSCFAVTLGQAEYKRDEARAHADKARATGAGEAYKFWVREAWRMRRVVQAIRHIHGIRGVK